MYKDSYWKKGFVGGSWEFLKDKGMGGRNLFYSPTEAFFDRSWQPGEFELVD